MGVRAAWIVSVHVRKLSHTHRSRVAWVAPRHRRAAEDHFFKWIEQDCKKTAPHGRCGAVVRCLAGDDDTVAPVSTAIDDTYLLAVVAIDIKCMAEQLHLLEGFFVVHGFDGKRLGAHNRRSCR